MLPSEAAGPGDIATNNRRFIEAVLLRSRTGSP